MKAVAFKDSKQVCILFHQEDTCPLCQRKMQEHAFRWLIFHGRAMSSCGIVLQLKSYSIDEPTEIQQQYLSLLDGDYYEFYGATSEEKLEELNIWYDKVVELNQDALDMDATPFIKDIQAI